MAEFWIEVVEIDSQFVAIVRELIAHNAIGSSTWIYDLRVSTARYGTREEAYAAGEKELKGFLAQLGRQDYIVTSEQRVDEKSDQFMAYNI
jgi:hypothetical protein